MASTLRRLAALAEFAALVGIGVEVAGHRALTRLVRRDVQALRARAAPAWPSDYRRDAVGSD